MAGTDRNHALAEYVRDRFREYGLDEVNFHEFPALLSFPRSAALAIHKPEAQTLNLREDPYPADKDSRLYDEPGQVAFHGYAPSGKVRAEVIYAYGGSPEDFQLLDRMGIDLKGKIVLMRYSDPYSYRGYKCTGRTPGAAGTIIYSDRRGRIHPRKVYPDGPGARIRIQWTRSSMTGRPGRAVHVSLEAGRNGRWVEGPQRDKQLPRIPSLPLSAKRRRDPEAAGRTRSAEGLAGRTSAHVSHRSRPGHARHGRAGRARGDACSVIGVIHGREEPGKGDPRQSSRRLGYGAVDPSSGTAALLETRARSARR
jgi:N-acetylated-alpha-linked acidic dipeptidase